MPFSKITLHGEQLTRENFTSPPREMGILPFWFWNGELDEEEMAWQLREYRDKGIPGLFIHGRFGLKVPYLSREWFERVRIAVRLAREIGIDIWIYDEMNWPSGTAERQVLKQYPHLRQKYLELVVLQVDGPLFTFLEATDSRYVNTGDSRPIAAYACSAAEFEQGIQKIIDLTPNLSFNKVVPWEAPEGKWKLLYFLEKEIDYYIDTLNPESTRRFIELTHEGYKAAVGEEFGTIVPGFYTDEPAIFYYQVGVDNYVVPWSSQMFKIFRQRRGYDLKPWLPALYAEMGAVTARIRYDFWRTLTEQYAECYYQRIREWCDENGVIFTGHLLFEEWLRGHARCEGNIFKYLQHMHLIGVDHLYPKIGSAEEPAEHVSLKMASSAAHHFGSSRLLCESMGGTYWDCTLERMKWIANWEYVLGVNLFNNHGYHYSIEGERKRDWPPSQFYHHTWWKHYDQFTTYMARLGHILSGGRHVAKILILYPINSIWANYRPQSRDRISTLIENDYNYLTDTLLRLHFDFDYVDEDVLNSAEIAAGEITIADEHYELLILPPLTHVKAATWDSIERFARCGGKIIADTLLPVGLFAADPAAPGGQAAHAADAEATASQREGSSNPEPAASQPQGASGPIPVAAGRTPGGSAGDSAAGRTQSATDLDPAASRVETLFGVDPAALLQRLAAGSEFSIEPCGPEGRLRLIGGQGLAVHKPGEALGALLHGLIEADVIISREEVFYLHRIKDGYDLYFLVNTSRQELGRVEVQFAQTRRPELWDPQSGEIRNALPFTVDQGRIILQLDFAATASHIVVFREAIGAAWVESTNLTIDFFDGVTLRGHAGAAIAEARVQLGGDRPRLVTTPGKAPLPAMGMGEILDFAIEDDNALCLSAWKMALESDLEPACLPVAADFADHSWLEVTLGAWEMQLPQERDEQFYPVPLWYRTSFNAEWLPEQLNLLIDGFSGSSHRLFVNGHEVTAAGQRSKLDAEIREIDIRPLVQTGRNVVAVRLVAERRTDGILDLLKITGRFALASGSAGWQITAPAPAIRPGDWCRQGYPFYSGTGLYTARLEVPSAWLDGRLYLQVDCGEDVLEVTVNGGAARVLPWHPYELDVTSEIKTGTNRIELRVTNTLINLLEGVPKKSGIFSEPLLVHRPEYHFDL